MLKDIRRLFNMFYKTPGKRTELSLIRGTVPSDAFYMFYMFHSLAAALSAAACMFRLLLDKHVKHFLVKHVSMFFFLLA